MSTVQGSFTLESLREYPASPGDAFEVSVRLRVDERTRALPALASYDAPGRGIPAPSSLATGPRVSESSRTAFAPWSAAYQRDGRPRLAHRWIRITIAGE